MATLSACCGKPPAPQVFQHANLTAKCPEPAPFDGSTSDDIVDAYLDLAAQYKDCAIRHNALVESLK